MIEDRSLNEFIRAKLEEDIGELPTVAIRRTGFRPALMAASVAVVCGLFAVHFRGMRTDGFECEAAKVIELLDSDRLAAGTETFAEHLLAWQDAPYVAIAD